MFTNSVFKTNVDTKKWLVNAGLRALRTFFQTFVATIGTSAMISEVDWKMVLSTSALAAVLSIATSLSGIPEVQAEEEKESE